MWVLEGIIPTGPIAVAVIKTLSVRMTGAAGLNVKYILIHLANVELPNVELPNAELVNAELPNAELLNVESN